VKHRFQYDPSTDMAATCALTVSKMCVVQRMWGGNKEPPAVQDCSRVEGAGFELPFIYCRQYAVLYVYCSIHATNINDGKGECEITIYVR